MTVLDEAGKGGEITNDDPSESPLIAPERGDIKEITTMILLLV